MSDRNKKSQPKKQPAKPMSAPPPRSIRAGRWLLAILLVAGLCAGALFASKKHRPSGRAVLSPPRNMTFNKDIAPIVFARCAGCHRPGESAPFNLLTYEDVKKHAVQIKEVTAKRYMPPWLPEEGYGDFANKRVLSADEINQIRQWVDQGSPEGSPADLPRMPAWVEGWQLGKPDLVLQVTQPFTLPVEGRDIYRNFIIPIPTDKRQYVRGFEFHAGNPKVIHHAFLKVDATRQSRRLDGVDGLPGFPGMNVPDSVEMPEGHFMSWQPGKVPSEEPNGLAWTLQQGSDLILQAHLRLSGKPETIQPVIGLYFTDQAPTNTCFKFLLTSLVIDIPPGARDYLIKDDFTLPADASFLAVLPHAHYLCKEMQGFATLPDGTKKWLILIKNWDFNWQGDYRYQQPVFLPKGTVLSMRYTYDNSTNNIANPHNPPQRVTYGPESADEMGELWFQVVCSSSRQRELLSDKVSEKMLKVFADRYRYELQIDPANAKANRKLGSALLGQGKPEEAIPYLRAAIRSDPRDDEPHYFLGLVLRQKNRPEEARAEFEKALQINPKNFKAHGNLGIIFGEEGQLDAAESHLRSALEINPNDNLARGVLEDVLKAESEMRRGKAPGRK